jgi:hypothetical protein
VKKWLKAHLPGWMGFAVQPAAYYLGFALGPKAADLQLSKTLKKWLMRVNALHACGLSMAANIVGYNVYAHSLCGYKAQLVHFPASLFMLEKKKTCSHDC